MKNHFDNSKSYESGMEPKTKAGKNSGFILLHRTIRSHWIWEDPLKLQWWLDILMECNHEDKRVNIGFQFIDCKRGQTINSLLTWAKRWRVDKSTVRRFLYLLQNDNMIEIENVQKTTRLTVCNYDNYNDVRHDKQLMNNSKATPKQLQSNSDATQTNNELNNELNKGEQTKKKKFRELTEKEFYAEVAMFKDKFPKDMLRDFYDYWSEPTDNGKMKFQTKDTWDLNRRLKRWQRNDFQKQSGVKEPHPVPETTLKIPIVKP